MRRIIRPLYEKLPGDTFMRCVGYCVLAEKYDHRLSGHSGALFLNCGLQIGERIEAGIVSDPVQELVDP
jgi:hypothetical protein